MPLAGAAHRFREDVHFDGVLPSGCGIAVTPTIPNVKPRASAVRTIVALPDICWMRASGARQDKPRSLKSILSAHAILFLSVRDVANR
jgi:hypothetical protein